MPADGCLGDYCQDREATRLVKHYFTSAGAIDRHNSKRMDGLRLELAHEFKTWWKRVFTSFLGVIVVDALAAFVLEQGEIDQMLFYEQLAMEMIWNDLDGAPERFLPKKRGHSVSRQEWQSADAPRWSQRKAARAAAAVPDDEERKEQVCNHEIEPLRRLEAYKNSTNAWLNCRVCKKNRATLYCKSCFKNAHGQILALCNPAVSSTCLSLHCQQPV